MAYYLSMDGVDDCIRTPSITFNKVVIDAFIHYRTSGAWTCLVSGISNNLTYSTSGSQSSSGYVIPATVNGIGTSTITNDTRNTIEVVSSSPTITGAIDLFSNSGTADFAQVNAYSVKFYNGSTLVAHYDMTLGNVQDQSGNGNNATLTGGTWVTEGGTTHSGASSVQGVSTITASATVIPAAITGSASLQGVATVSATANVINAPMTGSASLQGVGTVTATASVIRTGSANIMGVSTLSVNAAGLSVLGGASLTGVGYVSATGIAGTSLLRKVYLYANQDNSVHLMASQDTTVYLYTSMSNSIVLEGDL